MAGLVEDDRYKRAFYVIKLCVFYVKFNEKYLTRTQAQIVHN